MATKELKTRIRLKYDTLANWSDTSVAGKGANTVLLEGEMGICYVPSVTHGTTTTAPTVLFKVGDGTQTFAQLPWASGLAADVYDWAKAENNPDTNTSYQLVKVADNKIKVQSKEIGGNWTDVSGQVIELVQNSSDMHKIGLKFGADALATWITLPDTYLAATSSESASQVAIGVTSGTELKYGNIEDRQISAVDTTTTATTAIANNDSLKVAFKKVENRLDTVPTQISTAIAALDYSDSATEDYYVSSVSETDGVIAVSRAALPKSLPCKENLSFGNKTYNGSVAQTITAEDLGVEKAMRFIGKATVHIEPNSTTDPQISGYDFSTARKGDVILNFDNNKEFVWDGTKWLELGHEGDWEVRGTAQTLINGLNVSDISGFGAGKTLATLSESAGKISASFQDISITKSQVSDFSHSHGNITNAGAIGSTADQAIYTTTSGVLTAGSLAVSDPTASGTGTTFIDTISQDSKGQITATKKTIDLSSKADVDHNHDTVYKKIQSAVSDPVASGNAVSYIDSISQDTQGVITATKKTIDFSNYKTKQSAVVDPTASGNSAAYIDSISQDENGVITATKKTVATLTMGSKTFNGSSAVSLYATDLSYESDSDYLIFNCGSSSVLV